eukprot:10465588-Alexandrium_andersonii.AAC.1
MLSEMPRKHQMLSEMLPRASNGTVADAPTLRAREVLDAESMQAFGAGAARALERPRNWPPKLPRVALCAACRADSESDDER